MENKIKTHSLGKLRIYVTSAEKVTHGNKTMMQKLFPKTAYVHIIEDAKAEGILNASAYTTHLGFSNKEKIQRFSVEGDNSKLTICIELVDTKENLQSFCLKHQDYLKGKVLIFKEVEFWNIV